MSDNGLEMKVTFDQFKAEKDMNKKLDMLFLVQLTHKTDCVRTVNDINNRIKAPKRNRRIDFGLGSAGGVTGYMILDKLIDMVKSYVSGG